MESPLSPRSSSRPPSRRHLSIGRLTSDATQAIQRFPLGFAYLTALCLWLILLVWSGSDTFGENACIALSFCLSAGTLISLVIPLWAGFSGRPRLSMPVQAAANAILAADFIFLLMQASALSTAGWISHSSVITALVVALLFIPDKRRPASAWYYSYTQITNIITSSIISMAMWLVVWLIYITLSMLFSINSWELMPTLGIIGGIFIPAVIFMGRIPAIDSLDDNAADYALTRFDLGIIKFLLLPIALIYMAILYVYGLKILFTFTLPVGMVVYPVTGFTAVSLLLIFLLGRVADGPLTLRVSRILPIAILPLLVLMSVSVLYRIGEYGITVSRLYVLTFNLWAYAAMIYLVVTRGRRFAWIPMSFALLFLAVSVIPGANYTSLTYSYMQSRIKGTFRAAGATKFPLDRNQVTELRDKVPSDEWRLMSSRLEYLDDNDDHLYTASIVSFPVKINSWQTDELFDTDLIEVNEVTLPVEINLDADGFVTIPHDYKYVSRARFSESSPKITDRKAFKAGIGNNLKLVVDIDSLASLHSIGSIDSLRIPLEGYDMHEAVFVPTSTVCRFDDDKPIESADVIYLSISGLLFTNFNISK